MPEYVIKAGRDLELGDVMAETGAAIVCLATSVHRGPEVRDGKLVYDGEPKFMMYTLEGGQYRTTDTSWIHRDTQWRIKK